MSRYDTQSPYKSYVLFSKVRYIRNISKGVFYQLSDIKRCTESLSRLDALLQKNGFRQEKTADGIDPHIIALCERAFVERDLIYTNKPRAIYLNEPCNLMISLGGDDLINITSVISGLSLDEALNTASGAEALLDRELDFAYNERVGYLSPRISECGSGIRLSAALFLPSLSISGISELQVMLSPHGITLSPLFFAKDSPADIYTVSYSPHYLANEGLAECFFSNMIKTIADREAEALRSLYSSNTDSLLNTARRAVGALLFSDTLREDELSGYLASIRLSLCLSPDSETALLPINALNYLSAEGLNSSVISSAKEKCNSQAECDRARARLVREYIEHIKEVK